MFSRSPASRRFGPVRAFFVRRRCSLALTVNVHVRNIKLAIKNLRGKHAGAEYPTCPRCTVFRLRPVQLRVSYFTYFIPITRHNQIPQIIFRNFFRRCKTFNEIYELAVAIFSCSCGTTFGLQSHRGGKTCNLNNKPRTRLGPLRILLSLVLRPPAFTCTVRWVG